MDMRLYEWRKSFALLYFLYAQFNFLANISFQSIEMQEAKDNNLFVLLANFSPVISHILNATDALGFNSSRLYLSFECNETNEFIK